MKSYTDLEQSKKLAEILPLESADMHYFNYGNIAKPYIGFDVNETRPEKNNEVYEYIPCWSLSALLSVLPEYHLSSPNLLGSMYCCRVKNIDIYADNPVDACVEMILELHELNLL